MEMEGVEIQTVIGIRDDAPEYDDIKSLFDEHGGNPVSLGVVFLQLPTGFISKDKLKVQFPDGHIEYFNIHAFHTYFEFRRA
jgi:hypothetical protein